MVHGRPGPAPQTEKREQFARLIARGASNAEACRVVGINRRTGKRWRHGREIASSSGRRLHCPPVINNPAGEISRRYLSEDERVRIADLHRAGEGVLDRGRAGSQPLDDQPRAAPQRRPGQWTVSAVRGAAVGRRTPGATRYVLDDRVAIGPAGCACGRPHAVLQRVEGRTEDQLALPRAGAAGTVTVHPIVLHHALDTAARGPWQVRWDGAQLSVDVVAGTADLHAVKRSLTAELANRGVAVDVAVRRVDAPRPSRLGKIRLVTDLTAPPGDG